jgi:hypothetical protein
MFKRSNLKTLFDKLKKSNDISDKITLYTTVLKIQKFAENDNEVASMLGQFVSKNSELLSDETKTLIKNEMKSENLFAYFMQRIKIDSKERSGFKLLSYVFAIGGILMIIAGFIQLINGDFSVGIGTRYLTRIVREGGTTLIIGILFFIGALIRIRFENKKNIFIRYLNNYDQSHEQLI